MTEQHSRLADYTYRILSLCVLVFVLGGLRIAGSNLALAWRIFGILLLAIGLMLQFTLGHEADIMERCLYEMDHGPDNL